MDYQVLVDYSWEWELLQNRMKVCNQVMGARYVGNVENPFRVTRKAQVVTLLVCGSPVRRWRLYDVAGIRDAVLYLDVAQDVLWQLSRSGRLVVTDNGTDASFVRGERTLRDTCAINGSALLFG